MDRLKECFDQRDHVLTQASQVVLLAKNLPAKAGDAGDVSSIPGLGRSLEEEMTAHSSILTWRVPWTEEPGRLQSMGLQELDMTYQLNHHTYGSHCLQYSHSFFHVTHTYISI